MLHIVGFDVYSENRMTHINAQCVFFLFVYLFAEYSNLILLRSVDGVGVEFLAVNKAPDDTANSREYFELSVNNMKTLKPLAGTYVI